MNDVKIRNPAKQMRGLFMIPGGKKINIPYADVSHNPSDENKGDGQMENLSIHADTETVSLLGIVTNYRKGRNMEKWKSKRILGVPHFCTAALILSYVLLIRPVEIVLYKAKHKLSFPNFDCKNM